MVARTFAITNAITTMAEHHDSMPVILESSDWPTWLCEVEDDPATLLRPSTNKSAEGLADPQACEFSEKQWRRVAEAGWMTVRYHSRLRGSVSRLGH